MSTFCMLLFHIYKKSKLCVLCLQSEHLKYAGILEKYCQQFCIMKINSQIFAVWYFMSGLRCDTCCCLSDHNIWT